MADSPYPDRSRGDSWVDTSRTGFDRYDHRSRELSPPLRRDRDRSPPFFGGDSYRPVSYGDSYIANRQEYDSYRPQYESAWHYSPPREPLSPLNGPRRDLSSRYDQRTPRSASFTRSQSPRPRTPRYRIPSHSRSRSRGRTRSRSRGRSPIPSRSVNFSRTRRSTEAEIGHRNVSHSTSRSSIASTHLSALERSERPLTPVSPPRPKADQPQATHAPESAKETVQHDLQIVSAAPFVVQIVSPRLEIVTLPASPHPPEEVCSALELGNQLGPDMTCQSQTTIAPAMPEQTQPMEAEIAKPLIEVQELHTTVMPNEKGLEEKPEILAASLEQVLVTQPTEIQPPGVGTPLEAEEPSTTTPPPVEAVETSDVLYNNVSISETPAAPSGTSVDLVEALVKEPQSTTMTPQTTAEEGPSESSVRTVLSPPIIVESPVNIENKDLEEMTVTQADAADISARSTPAPPSSPELALASLSLAPRPPSPPAGESPVPQSEVTGSARPANPAARSAPITTESATHENNEASQSIPPLTEAKTTAEALRIVVMTRLLCDRQTREERVNPVLMANLSISRPVEIRLSTSIETLINEVCDGKRHENRTSSFAGIRHVLQKRFEDHEAARLDKIQRLRTEYLALHEKWVQHCVMLDEQSRVLASETDAVQPSGRTTRRSAATLGDAVRSDLEMEQIIASLGNDEATDPAHLSLKNLATIPDMISVTRGKVDYVFDDTNHPVENPSEYYGPQTGMHDWTEEEKKIFLDKFAAYPKQFGIIADFLPNKTPAQCVAFYYLHKKKLIDFRKVVSQFAPNKRRRRGTGKKKGNALIADIQQHDAEISGIDLTLSTVPSRASKGRRAAAQSESGRRALNSRRMVIQQQDGTPASTPTPEPDTATAPATRNRRRRGQAVAASRTASIMKGEAEEDGTDGDPRPPKRAKRSRRSTKVANVAVEEQSTPTTPIPDSASAFGSFTTETRIREQTETTISRRRAHGSSTVHWSKEDKSLFMSLLAQYGDDCKRIAASMPNKTMVQVSNFYQSNLVELGLESIAANAPRRSPTPPPPRPSSSRSAATVGVGTFARDPANEALGGSGKPVGPAIVAEVPEHFKVNTFEGPRHPRPIAEPGQPEIRQAMLQHSLVLEQSTKPIVIQEQSTSTSTHGPKSSFLALALADDTHQTSPSKKSSKTEATWVATHEWKPLMVSNDLNEPVTTRFESPTSAITPTSPQVLPSTHSPLQRHMPIADPYRTLTDAFINMTATRHIAPTSSMHQAMQGVEEHSVHRHSDAERGWTTPHDRSRELSSWLNIREAATSDVRSQASGLEQTMPTAPLSHPVSPSSPFIYQQVPTESLSFSFDDPRIAPSSTPLRPSLSSTQTMEPPLAPPPVMSASRRLLSVAALTGADEPPYPPITSSTSAAVPPSRFYS
ncbi:hypothetical protein AX17_002497 [Amanita inopinata Kibby_2008]|nr:hypothetical protein AX17_002497 [Amanita inopinata Kibby_2008]